MVSKDKNGGSDLDNAIQLTNKALDFYLLAKNRRIKSSSDLVEYFDNNVNIKKAKDSHGAIKLIRKMLSATYKILNS